MSGSLNPLVSAAAALLGAAPRIRAMAQHPNPAQLKASLSDAVQRFETQARAQSVPNEKVVAARYILCTLLDEAAAATPWGGSGAWSAHSLLVQFHNEGNGGEKVFVLMSRLAQDVHSNRDLLELLYVALAFGFEGRYGDPRMKDGKTQLDSVRNRLAEMLQKERGPYEADLASHWQGVAAGGSRLSAGVPVWLVGVVAVGVLALLYGAFRFAADANSEPIFAALQALDVKAATLQAAPPPPPAAKPRLAGLLKPEIDAGQVIVQDYVDRSVVTLKGDGFFDAGSAEINGNAKPALLRIGEELNKLPGQVVISGHSDSQPIRTLRFPSNWHLSVARAQAVREMLGTAAKVAPERMRSDGQADASPLDSNATPEGRARNRRVEITLYVPAAS
jgi:type VI secretion system protein ImpK